MNPKFQNKDTIHVDAAIILARLKNSAPGQVIGYKELSNLIGRNVQAEARYIMETARRHAKKERIYFGVVTNVGLQRLDDSGKVKVGSGMLSKIRRTSRRAAQTLAAVENFNTLPNDLKVAHNTALSVYGIITQATSRKLQDKIAERVEGVEGGALAMKKSLELFA